MRLLHTVITLSLLFTSGIYAEVLAVVNGEKVTTEVAPKNFATLPQDQRQRIVERLIQKRVAIQYALSTDIIKDDAFKKALAHVIGYDATPTTSSKSTLADALKHKGFTKEQERSKKGLLAFDFLLDRKVANMHPNDDVLKAYYEQNRYKYDTPEMVEIASIVVENEKEADKMMNLLAKNPGSYEHFAAIARRYSKGPDAKEGGYLGKIPVSELNPKISKAVTMLKRNTYTKPIKTVFGYQIYYLINHIPEVKTTYDMVKDRVKEEYIRMKVKEWAQEKIKHIREKASVQIPPSLH